MARAKNKQELIEHSKNAFQKLNDLIDSYSDEEKVKEFPAGTLNRNIRDVVAHLHHWQLMLIDWYTVGITGVKPDMPAKGYTWKEIPALNIEINKMYNDLSLKEARQKNSASFNQIQALIEKHSNEELFEKKRYVWTGSTSMGAYFVSAVSSHYDWAIKLIKKAKR